jgi:hypothetical protein
VQFIIYRFSNTFLHLLIPIKDASRQSPETHLNDVLPKKNITQVLPMAPIKKQLRGLLQNQYKAEKRKLERLEKENVCNHTFFSLLSF